MHDLAHWLEQLGMSKYAQRFAEKGINSVMFAQHKT
jgi:SAM domain (Sterile alpha motif)